MVRDIINLEGCDCAQWKYDYALTKGGDFLPRSVNDEFELTASETVKGKRNYDGSVLWPDKLLESITNKSVFLLRPKLSWK